MEPPRWTRLRGPIQCSLEFSHLVEGVSSFIGNHRRLPPTSTQTKCGPFPPPGFCCPWPQQYYGPLRLPLRARPFHGDTAYRVRRSQSPRRLAHAEAHCWGGDGSLLFPRRLCHRSTPLTPQGSSVLHLQALHTFRGLRPTGPGSAPCSPPEGQPFSTRQASLHAADRWLAPSQ